MSTGLKRLYVKILGNSAFFRLEKRLIHLVTFLGVVGSLFWLMVNLLFNPKMLLLVVNGTEAAFLAVLYYLARFRDMHRTSLNLLTMSLYIINPAIWMLNDGSGGPAGIVIILMVAVLSSIYKGELRIVVASVFTLEMLLLYYIELAFPHYMMSFDTALSRAVDNFSGFSVTVGIFLVFITIFTRAYEREKKKASGKAVALEATNRKLSRLVSMLEKMSLLDELTGIPNRRHFNERLSHELRRCKRKHTPISMLLIDIDDFKKFNDIYGHTTGDKYLKLIAECMNAALHRPADIPARFGGEEFAIILPETGSAGAIEVAERLLEYVENIYKNNTSMIPEKVTASIGIVSMEREFDGIDENDIINRADEALYQAKNSGKNCVKIFRDSGVKEVSWDI